MAFDDSVSGAESAPPHSDRFWQELVAEYGGHVQRCVASTMRRFGWFYRPEEVEDVSQDVWLHLWQRRPESLSRWRTWEPARLCCYLGRVAHNAVVDELRRRRAVKRGGGCVVEVSDAEKRARELDALPAPQQDPEEQALAEERATMLRQRLAPMLGGGRSHRDAGILVLALVEGRTSVEIAALLEGALAESSVHTVVHRARAALARHSVEEVRSAMGLGGGIEGGAARAQAIG